MFINFARLERELNFQQNPHLYTGPHYLRKIKRLMYHKKIRACAHCDPFSEYVIL